MPGEVRALAEAVAARALGASGAPETDVLIKGGREALTRFAGNEIHQNLAREVLEISIRATEGGRTGRASTNRTDPDALAKTAARALEVARNTAPRDGLLPCLAAHGPYPETRCWDAGTAEATPERRARDVAALIGIAAERGFTAAGSFTSDDRFEAVANSRGLFAFGRWTSSILSTTVTAADSSGYAEDGSSAMNRIDARALGRTAADKAALSANPGEIEPGEYTVILEPQAVAEMLIYLQYGNSFCHFSGLAVREGQSWFAERLGTRVFSEAITLRDDVYHPMQWGTAFDAEGVPRRAVTLIANGVAAGVTWDRATAALEGTEPTGHGLAVPNVYGSIPENLVLEGGSTPVDAMIGATKRGVLITRLWYNRLVDPADLIVTGLTRDGTFLIEDGRIVKGLRNYRFNQSLRALLNQVTHLSAAVRAGPGVVAPAMRVEGFRLTSVVPRES